MALTRMVNGKEVAISAEEEAKIMAERAVAQGKKDLEIIQAVKAEANRRITSLCPEWKQRNLLAQAAQLTLKGKSNWTAEDQAAWDAGDALWKQIEAIRAKSDLIEAMTPVPADFNEDKHWPKE